MPTDFETPTGKVRLLTADLSEPYKISNEILEGYLGIYEGTDPQCMIWRAAADALDAMGTSELLESKKIRSQDLSTDGPAVAAALYKKAAELRARADEADGSANIFFDIIPNGAAPSFEGAEARW